MRLPRARWQFRYLGRARQRLGSLQIPTGGGRRWIPFRDAVSSPAAERGARGVEQIVGRIGIDRAVGAEEALLFSTVQVTTAVSGQIVALGQVSYRLLEPWPEGSVRS
jgi:hypothetical protein